MCLLNNKLKMCEKVNVFSHQIKRVLSHQSYITVITTNVNENTVEY